MIFTSLQSCPPPPLFLFHGAISLSWPSLKKANPNFFGDATSFIYLLFAIVHHIPNTCDMFYWGEEWVDEKRERKSGDKTCIFHYLIHKKICRRKYVVPSVSHPNHQIAYFKNITIKHDIYKPLELPPPPSFSFMEPYHCHSHH